MVENRKDLFSGSDENPALSLLWQGRPRLDSSGYNAQHVAPEQVHAAKRSGSLDHGAVGRL
jgi:hypothetical protein